MSPGNLTASKISESGPTWRLWKVAEVAHALGVSRTWVYEHAASGQLPSLRIGGGLRFDPEAIRSYAFEQRRAPAIIPFRKREG
jgi:excisionase family DNA binding protein